MCDFVNFHSQLAAIIDVLAKSAVAEISRLVDDGYAILRLEVSQSQKQNEALKRRLRMMEQRVSQAPMPAERTGGHGSLLNNRAGVRISQRSEETTVEDCSLTEEGPVGKGRNFRHRSDGYLTAGHEECSPGQPDVADPVQLVSLAEVKPELCPIKQEKPEEDPRNGALEQRAGRRVKRPIEETQNKAENHTEELTEQHRNRRAVWEVSGLESVLKAEGQSECVETLQHRGAEHRLGGLNSADSDFVMFERPGQPGSYCSQGSVEFGGDSASEMSSDLQLVHVTEDTGKQSWSPSAPQDEELEVIVMDLSPVKMEDGVRTQPFWSSESRSGAFGTQRMGGVPSPPYADRTARENAGGTGHAPLVHSLYPSPSVVAAAGCSTGKGKARYVCKYCGKDCYRASDLKVHQRVHTGEKPFSCTQCGRRFSQSCSLKKHLLIHTGEKPFSCTQCGCRFNQSSSLKKHLLVHSGKKPFACLQCGRQFSDSSNLRKHTRVHTGERPTGCAQRGEGYTNDHSLKMHLAAHHAESFGV